MYDRRVCFRDDQECEEICDHTRNNTSCKYEEDEDDTEQYRINVEIFSKAADDTGYHSVSIAASKFFHMWAVYNLECVNDILALNYRLPIHALCIFVQFCIGVKTNRFGNKLKEWDIRFGITDSN
jgi:hypothetical protein